MKIEDINTVCICIKYASAEGNTLSLEEFSKFDKYKEISNKGGLKFNFNKPAYISSKNFNTYKIVKIMDNPIMAQPGIIMAMRVVPFLPYP